jgi:hypothetical protein
MTTTDSDRRTAEDITARRIEFKDYCQKLHSIGIEGGIQKDHLAGAIAVTLPTQAQLDAMSEDTQAQESFQSVHNPEPIL